MADDLEQAIILVYENSSNGARSLIDRALSFLDSLQRSPPQSLLRLTLHRLSSPATPIPVRFWCLQAIHDSVICSSSTAIDTSDLSLLRSSLLSLATSPSSPIHSSPVYVKNKLAQCLSTLVRLHYPKSWSEPFLYFISSSPAGLDSLFRLLITLDEDLLSQDYVSRSPAEVADAGRVKDGIRSQCARQLAGVWFDAVRIYSNSDPALAALALDAARRCAAWIDISLVANDAFLPLLIELVRSNEQLRSPAASVLLGIVWKRMDHVAKLALLKSLRISFLFSMPEVMEVADLVIGYAGEALECYNKTKMASSGEALQLLEEVLPSVLYLAQNSEDLDSVNVLEFLSSYVNSMKSMIQKQVAFTGKVLELVYTKMQYDPAYRKNLDLGDKIGKDEEDQMAEKRKDLVALFRSVCKVLPDDTHRFISNLLAGSSSGMSVEATEAAVSLLYYLGETISAEELKSGMGLLRDMIPMLLTSKFPCHSHRVVALVYLETVTRYLKFVQEKAEYIPTLLAAYLDERGIHHPNVTVSRRASYLFMRAVKLLRSKLVPYIETILQSLQDTVTGFTVLDWKAKDVKCSGSEDGSHTFEAIGILIGMEDVPFEKQAEYLEALLTPLCRQVESLILDAKLQKIEEFSARIASVQQTIMAINALSKGFSEHLVTTSRPAIGIMFKQTLNVLMQLLAAFPNVEALRSKISSFLHRMVGILGTSVFPYLPIALKQLFVESEPHEMVEFFLLVNQLICKFKKSISSILEEMFPAIAGRLLRILPSDAFSSGPGCNTEEIRELHELQRILYTFLHVMATHGLSSVFLASSSRAYLDALMQLLLVASCKHKDMQVRKQCVQIFVRLIEDWCGQCNGDDKLPGFRSFIIEIFATNCCLYSVLDPSFDFRDANTLVLFGEIVAAEQVMYQKFGNDFVAHFVAKALPSAHCPQELAEEYRRKLQGNDIKAFRSFYQSLIGNLRQQQNGSLVFR